MSEQQGRMTEEGFERLSLKGECLSAEAMMLVAEARRARASEARLLAEREDLIKALAFLASWRMRDGSPCFCPAGKDEDEPKGRMRTDHATACAQARSVLTRVRAHDEEGGR